MKNKKVTLFVIRSRHKICNNRSRCTGCELWEKIRERTKPWMENLQLDMQTSAESEPPQIDF